MHVTSCKNNLLNLRYLLTLEGKEEVLLHKLVVKFNVFSVVEVRLINTYTRGIG